VALELVELGASAHLPILFEQIAHLHDRGGQAHDLRTTK